MLGKEKKRIDVNIQRSENSGMEIPDYAIERIARCLLPMIQAYYESDEGQAQLAMWNEKKDAEDTREQDRKTA